MIGLPHRTMIALSPSELVRVAAAAGFDAVGFPLIPVRADEPAWRILEDPAVFAATAAALAAHGVSVLDVELIALAPDTPAAAFRPLFDAAARLGARFVTVTATDPDEARVAACFAALCADAAPYGLRLGLEFMERSAVRTLDAARRIVAAAGHPAGGIVVDACHFARSGGRPADLVGLEPALFPYMQINDVADTASWTKVLPGDGTLPLVELLHALPAAIPIALEVPRQWSAAEDPLAFARRAYAATRRIAAPG